jgi:hypothetical protein
MIPQSRSHIIMKKNVVHNFPVSFAQVASIHNDDLSFPEIIRCKNLIKGCQPRKERRPRRSLSPPHTLPREMTTLTASQGAEIGFNLEHPFLGRDSPKPVSTISTHHG